MRGHLLRASMGRVLVGYDGSPPSKRALDHAVRRALVTKDEVLLLTVLPPSIRESSLAAMMPAGIELPPEMSGTFVENAQRRLVEVAQEAAGQGVAVKAAVLLGEPAETILHAALEMKADEIVIGHKSYEKQATLGPNAMAIVMRSAVPVTTVP